MDTQELQQLKLAFVLDHVRRIVDADGSESYAEFRFVGQLLPRPLLRDAGFLDDDGGLTSTFEAWCERARAELPHLTDAEQKEEIFQLLYAACAVDDLAPEEALVLQDAGRTLGIADSRIVSLLGTLVARG